MSEEMKNKAAELTDEEAEKATGAVEESKPTKKRCNRCQNCYDVNLGSCPICGSYWFDLVYLPTGDKHIGPR